MQSKAELSQGAATQCNLHLRPMPCGPVGLWTVRSAGNQ